MKCMICKEGKTAAGETTVTLMRNNTTVIVKGVPAEVCDNCGDYYLSEKIAERVMELAEMAVARNAEVEIIRFAA